MRSLIASLRRLILPYGAGAGMPRLVLGPDLPPPLNTYIVPGYSTTYAAGFIFNGSGDDSSYCYLCTLDTNSTAQSVIHVGQVVNGQVVQNGGGFALVQEWLRATNLVQHKFKSDVFQVLAGDNPVTRELLLDAGSNGVVINSTGDAAGIDLNAGAGSLDIFGADLTINGKSAAGNWTDFSASLLWTSTSGVDPVENNASVFATYRQVGKTVDYSGEIVFGNATTFGGAAGVWEINWPVTPNARAGTFGGWIGSAWVFDSSTGATWSATVVSASTTKLRIAITNAAAAGYLTNAFPVAWATGDRFAWNIRYQAL